MRWLLQAQRVAARESNSVYGDYLMASRTHRTGVEGHGGTLQGDVRNLGEPVCSGTSREVKYKR
jgi:hypothetical protein